MKLKMLINAYGNVDSRDGRLDDLCRAGVVVRAARLPASSSTLQAARVVFAKVLVGFKGAYHGRWTPDLKGWALDADWKSKVEAWRRTRRGQAELAEARRSRQQAAKRAASTRRTRSILDSTPYGRLLRALDRAQGANERAKARSANGIHFHGYSGGRFRRANYRSSRAARARDYAAKEQAIGEATGLASAGGVKFGWARSDDAGVPWVVYFEIPTGQVSFHSPTRGVGPDYDSEWDGAPDMTRMRLDAAIQAVLNPESLFDSKKTLAKATLKAQKKRQSEARSAECRTRSLGIGSRRCYNCGSEDHLARECDALY